MNKNIVKLFAIVMMIFMIGAVLVACGGSKGEQGEQGIQGNPGVPGEQGPEGPAGHTPYIGENGNWWINGEDTGICPEGKDATDCENHQFVYQTWPGAEHTMTTLGLEIGICSDCGDAVWNVIGHEYDIVAEVVKPTCTEGGYTLYECACGAQENVERDLVDALGHTPGDKEPAKNELNECECTWGKPWIIRCTECNVQLEAGNDVPEEERKHVYNEEDYHPVKDDYGIQNPCTWAGGEVAKCANCDHDKCQSPFRPYDSSNAPGHKWGEWSVKSEDNGVYTLVRTCSVCSAKFQEGTETITIGLDDCKLVAVAPKCDETGSNTYTYEYTLNDEAKSLLVKYEVVAATGHSIAADAEGVVDVANWNVTVDCTDCDEKVVIALPALADCELVKAAECDDNYNYYKATVAHNGVEIVVEFEIPANVGHNYNNYGDGAEWFVIDINGTLYDAYWCETCQHWIAVSEHK